MTEARLHGALLALVLALGGTMLAYAFDEGRRSGGGVAEPPPPPPRRGEIAWVVPPGREPAVMALLGPARARGVSGRAIAAVEIERSTIRARLAGGGALVVRARGARPTLDVRIEGAPDDSRLRAELSTARADAIFVARGQSDRAASSHGIGPGDPDARPAGASDPGPRGIGLLGPAARASGLSPWLLIALALALGYVGALVTARLAPVPAPATTATRPSWLLVGVVAIGIAARIVVAATVPLETDEARPLTDALPLLAGTHDTWLHPPLYRAIGRAWVALVAWTPADGALLLRVPSVLATAVLLALVARITRRGGVDARVAALASIPVLLGPDAVMATTLARPYALAAMLAGVTIACTGRGRLGTCAAVLAAGMAAWADPLSGLLAGAALLVSLRRAPAAAIAAALTLAVVVAPLVPGVVELLGGAADAIAPDRAGDPRWGMGRGQPLRLALELVSYASLGISRAGLAPLGIALLVLLTWRTRGEGRGWLAALFLGLVLAEALGLVHAVRPRNLIVLPLLFTSAAAWCEVAMPHRVVR